MTHIIKNKLWHHRCKNLSNRLNKTGTCKQAKSVKDGGSIASIVLEIQEREDNEIRPHFIHEVKTKKG